MSINLNQDVDTMHDVSKLTKEKEELNPITPAHALEVSPPC